MPRGTKNTIRNIFGRLVLQENGCAIWPGETRSTKGYGRVEFEGRLWTVHKLIYHHFVAPVPDGMTLDHLCRNRACANFAHLEVVTAVENVMRGDSPHALNARRSHCKNGHLYTETDYRGRRYCRICENERKKLRMRRVFGWKPRGQSKSA